MPSYTQAPGQRENPKPYLAAGHIPIQQHLHLLPQHLLQLVVAVWQRLLQPGMRLHPLLQPEALRRSLGPASRSAGAVHKQEVGLAVHACFCGVLWGEIGGKTPCSSSSSKQNRAECGWTHKSIAAGCCWCCGCANTALNCQRAPQAEQEE